MSKLYCLMYDLGTSSLKAILYGQKGKVICQETVKYKYTTPAPGWVEMDPADWKNALWQTIGKIAGHYDLSFLQAISFTGQMHSVVMLDKKGKALKPCLLWLDRRADQETKELQKNLKLPPYMLNSTYSLPKMYWLSKHNPELVKETETILWPKDYLRYLLTGFTATDATEGIGGGLLNWETGKFVIKRLEFIGWDKKVLPPILEADGQAGNIKEELAKKYNINPAVKVFTGCGDMLALLGGAPHSPGRLVYSLGSSSMFFTMVDQSNLVAEGNSLYTLKLAGYNLFGGVSSTTGAALVWFFENIWQDNAELSEMVKKAWEVTPGCEGLVFIPYLAGERSPYWSDKIKGGFYGLGLEHDKRHLARAVLESVAYSIRHLLDIYSANGIKIDEIALAGGGVRIVGWPQLIADICKLPIKIYSEQETVTNVLYVMVISKLKGKHFQETLLHSFKECQEFLPRDDNEKVYNESYRRYREFSVFANQQN